VLGKSVVLTTAQNELTRGVRGMLGRELRRADSFPHEPAIMLATLSDLKSENTELTTPSDLAKDAYWLTHRKIRGVNCLIVTAPNGRGVLYGVFELLRRISLGEDINTLNEVQQPFVPLRWVNQWDNLDGRIERGYAGPSIFFENGKVRADLQRAADYTRILASIGINGCTINNVNANPRLLTDEFIPEVARIADVFRPWGVQLSLAVDLSSPKVIGGLDTFDPLDARVAEAENRSNLPGNSGLRRFCDEGGLRRARRSSELRADASRCRECNRANAQATRRCCFLSGLCLRPSSRLAQSEK
jgi:alpha-glucuronidase